MAVDYLHSLLLLMTANITVHSKLTSLKLLTPVADIFYKIMSDESSNIVLVHTAAAMQRNYLLIRHDRATALARQGADRIGNLPFFGLNRYYSVLPR
jgi:hypothetical protein